VARPTDITRRAALGACVAAPLAGAALLAGRARGALVGARAFRDSRVEGAVFPKRLIDAAGQVQTLPEPPRRIVSTYLACDEMLADLVDIDRVAGISTYADDATTSNCLGVYPPRVARLRAEPERVLALEPDLVCVAAYTDTEALRLLAGAGVVLLRWSGMQSFAAVNQGVRLLGAALGEEERAGALVAQVIGELDGVARRLRGARPVRVLYYDTPGYTMGSSTLVDEMLTRAGGLNVAAEIGIEGPGQIGIEAVLALQPEAIVMPRYGDAVPAQMRLERQPLWQAMPAVAANRVFDVPAAWLTTVSHHAARGLSHIARMLHPEAFRLP
jgi:iron complex transport system substrate-binding protein